MNMDEKIITCMMVLMGQGDKMDDFPEVRGVYGVLLQTGGRLGCFAGAILSSMPHMSRPVGNTMPMQLALSHFICCVCWTLFSRVGPRHICLANSQRMRACI